MDISPGERQRIYEEEKARLDIRCELEAPSKKRRRIIVWLSVAAVAAVVLTGGLIFVSRQRASADARAGEIEAFVLSSKIYRSAQVEFLRGSHHYSWEDLADFSPDSVSRSGDGSYYVTVLYRGRDADGKPARQVALCRAELVAGIPSSKCPQP